MNKSGNNLRQIAKEIKERNRYILQPQAKNFQEWILQHEINTKQGFPWTLSGHEYQKEILAALNSEFPRIVVEKAAQVGISTLFLLESFYLAEKYSAKSLYYFPTDNDIADFSLDRADTMIEATAHLQRIASGINNVHLKHIAGGSIYFRGLWSKRKVKSVDGDILYLDELDEAKGENVEFSRDRLLHSSLGYQRSLSQPSVPDFGIDIEFKKGTQEYYFLKCPHCGHYQCLELELEADRFPRNFKKIPKKWLGGKFPRNQKYYRGCLKCGAILDMSKGEMVASFPSRNIRSFHLSQLYSQIQQKGQAVEDRIMEQLLAARSSFAIARAVISIIGNPYIDSNLQPLNNTVLDRVCGEYGLAGKGSWCFMGVDQGDTLTITIGEGQYHKLRTIYLEETQDWKKLYKFMDQYDIDHCIIDALPNKSDAKRLAAAFPGRVTIQYFTENFKMDDEPFIDDNQQIEIPTIKVNRDETLDEMVYMIKEGNLLLPRKEIPVVEDCRRHLKNLYKIKDDTTGRVSYKKKIENHFGMALNSMRLAMIHAPVSSYVGIAPVGGRLR